MTGKKTGDVHTSQVRHKYSVGQEAYFIQNDKVARLLIRHIIFIVYDTVQTVEYGVHEYEQGTGWRNTYFQLNEDQIFLTQEELFESIKIK